MIGCVKQCGCGAHKACHEITAVLDGGVQAFDGFGVMGVKHAHAHQNRRNRTIAPTGRAIHDLDRDAHPFFRDDCDVNAFCAGLDGHLVIHRAHQTSAGAPLARDKFRVLCHRLGQPGRGLAAGIMA